MRIENGIVYGDSPLLKVTSVRTLNDNKIEVTFSTKEIGVFDMTPLLDKPAFAPLKDKAAFDTAHVDFGIVVWLDGEIDIAPETLYDGCIFETTL